LYVTHENQVEVLDPDSGKVVGVIHDAPGVHGVAISPDLQRGFTSNGADTSVSVFDTKTLKVLRKIAVNSPDFIFYDAFSRRVFPMSKITSVLDAQTGEMLSQLDLGGSPESAASDGNGTLYVNLADKAAVAVVDTKALQVINTFPIERCTSPHSLSYDADGKRLLIGCSNGFRAVDAGTGKMVGAALMWGGVDASAFDRVSKLVFESCGEGVLSVIRQITPDVYDLIDSVPTKILAKTMAFDPKTKRIYLSTANVEWIQGADPHSNAAPRPRVKPGTFRVLVLEP